MGWLLNLRNTGDSTYDPAGGNEDLQFLDCDFVNDAEGFHDGVVAFESDENQRKHRRTQRYPTEVSTPEKAAEYLDRQLGPVGRSATAKLSIK